MKILFHKYSSTGNDFILLDNRDKKYDFIQSSIVENLCHRRFGVGADGVIFLEKSAKLDFSMRFFNADGSAASFCGNGARAITHFAHHLLEDKSSDRYTFEINNRVIKSEILDRNEVIVEMPAIFDLDKIKLNEFGLFLGSLYVDTGVPHAVFITDAVFYDYDLKSLYKKVNKNHKLFPHGVNVSVMEVMDDGFIALRTQERGVEDETYSCGTAAVAAAILTCRFSGFHEEINIQVKGGKLKILLDKDFKKIKLCGKAEKIFCGEIEV